MTARAPDRGGDEVAALARSFNQMGDELASRAHALELSDKARRQLLAEVSHELMTPLTAMRGYIETLTMKELDLEEQTRERYLHIIDDETHRLEHIIGDLLDLARLEGVGGTLRRLKILGRRDFLQHCFGSVAREEPSGGELDRRDARQVAWSRECDLVPVRQLIHESLERTHRSTDSAPGPASARAASAHMYRRLIS